MSIVRYYRGYKTYAEKYAESHPEHDSDPPTEGDTNEILIGYVLIILTTVLTAIAILLVA